MEFDGPVQSLKALVVDIAALYWFKTKWKDKSVLAKDLRIAQAPAHRAGNAQIY